ncbi:fumarate hydratase [Shouchella sp. JSM 1781072]|uniref:fumarate hydratase n=1 Tax=Bacillaceae TaxID=186817 RepID=UPI000C08AC9E|nr:MULTISPECIES: fumarate hydratase [Bacillaceae]UTR06920.1 fumarate hydratase [Alkalihalobacillus sp. LMS6]
MRKIDYEKIVEVVREACQNANYELEEDMVDALQTAKESEDSPVAGDVLKQLLDNAAIAKAERLPMCQDTGTVVCFVEMGENCTVVGGNVNHAINQGVREGYEEGYLRHSIVAHPLTRKKNNEMNTPAIIHFEHVPGDQLRIQLTAKGGGAENMSQLRMLTPSAGVEGVKAFVLETVKAAGPNACPPIIVGVGIGGNFEKCAVLAKKSLFRSIGERSQDHQTAQLEEALINEINELGIGPQGLGGKTTAIDVNIELEACHIAALPVAVNLNCHAVRHRTLLF